MCMLSPWRSVLQPSTYNNFTKLIKSKVAHYIRYIEQNLNYITAVFRKPKSKYSLLPANQKGRRQSSEPIKSRRIYIQLTQSAGKRVERALLLLLIGGTF